MYYVLYQIISLFLFVAAFPVFLLYTAITGKHRTGLGQRFGFIKNQISAGHEKKYRIWLHAASVGEVQVARSLIFELKEMIPDAALVLSTVNVQGYIVAQKQLKDVSCIFAPLDLPFAVSRALAVIKPTLYVCVETELWPTLLKKTKNSGCQLLLVNGRLSESGFKKYFYIKGFTQKMLSVFTKISTIRQTDAERFIALGARPEQVEITGNAKYDLCVASTASTSSDDYRQWLNLGEGQTVLMSGSTHAGEEEVVLNVYRRLKKVKPDLVWIAAPRLLKRLPAVETFFARENLAYDRLSAIKSLSRKNDVVLVDTMGDLSGLYSQATFVFCGGSLVPRGGHNIMEAAAWGKPVFYGPYMKDFEDAKEILESDQAGGTIHSAEELHDRILSLIKNPDAYKKMAARARAVALSQTGSARRQAQLIKNVLYNAHGSIH